MLANTVPAVFVLLLLYSNFLKWHDAFSISRLSYWLLIFQLTLAAFFFIFRSPAQATSWKAWDILIAFAATFLPSLFSQKQPGALQPAGISLQILGNVLSLYAMVSLGRRLAILPANRGIQKKGLYRLVRHPLYASYQLTNLGYLINSPSSFNLLIAGLCLLTQMLRIYNEERLLEKDLLYRDYQKKVPWRLIPFLF